MSDESAYIAAVHPRFEDYKDKYPHVRMERTDDGVLTLTLHTDGDSLRWSFETHHELGYVWTDVGADPDTKIIVVTGAGESFIARLEGGYQTRRPDASEWIFDHTEAKRLVTAYLDIEQPIIAAVNGPVWTHCEIPLLADVAVAASHSWFLDRHVLNGLVPGDGAHILFPLLLGLNRAKYYLLTGKRITAQEALALGVIAEVVEASDVLPRALELAREILRAPAAVVRLFRPTLMQQVKQQMLAGLSHGLMLEGMAALDHWPYGGPSADAT